MGVRQQLNDLTELVLQQQARMAEQDDQIRRQGNELASQRDHVARQEDEIARLRRELAEREQTELARPASAASRSPTRRRTVTRRRALLSLGGASAAASVAIVAGRLSGPAHAAPAAGGAGDGTAIVQGSANVNTSQTGTVLNAAASSGPAALLTSDNSGSSSTDETMTSGITGIGPSNMNGVIGVSSGSSGFGVWGQSDAGYGVVGQSTTGIDLGIFGTGRFQQRLQVSAGAPTSGTYLTGEQIRDSKGELWLCTAGGSPGTWVRAAHVPSGYSGGGTAVLSKGIRLLDTRGGDSLAKNQGGGPYTPAGSPYHLSVAGVNWQGVTVPGSAVAAIGLVTAVPSPSGGGYIALVPQGTGFSGTASLAYNAGLISGSSFTVGLSGGAMDIIIGGFPTDVVIDLFAVVA